MMKKLIFILAMSFLLLPAVKAELFQFGIKAGLGLNSLRIEDLTGLDNGSEVYDLVTGDGVMGYHVGIQTRIKIAMLFVQPELYFNDAGGTLEKVVSGGASELMNVDFKRIDLPIMLGAKFGPLRINAGPVGSYVVKESITNDIADIPADYTVFTNAMTWGFQAGLGLDFSKFSIDARYEGSLSKLGESLNIGGSDFALDARPRQFVFSLGFWF
jgi:hypothetical protein